MDKRQQPWVNRQPEKQPAVNQPSGSKPPDANAKQPENLQTRRAFKRKRDDVKCGVCIRLKYETRCHQATHESNK